jgi:UDP-N-acetylglucosamine 2-epimerase (hydrolysing)
MKSILFVSGTRADYGKMKPLAKCAQSHGFHVTFWITGMHVLNDFGLTKLEIYKDGYDATDEYINQNSNDLQSSIIAKTISAFTDYLSERTPDLVVIHGDRPEAIACAIAAATNYFNVLHIEGGEVSGTIDESFRHAVSKFANVHCVCSDQAKERLIRMGENPDFIYNIGSPELDLHLQCEKKGIAQAKDYYGIKFEDYAIVSFHSVTSELDTILDQTKQLFSALDESRKNFVVIKPNNDPGSGCINTVLKDLPCDRFRVLPSMRFEYFSVLMQNSAAMIGNSSSVVREAPFLGVPSLNVGSRQTNRALSDKVVHVEAQDKAEINSFLNDKWGLRFASHIGYGDGSCIKKFSKLLNNSNLFTAPKQKIFYEAVNGSQ